MAPFQNTRVLGVLQVGEGILEIWNGGSGWLITVGKRNDNATSGNETCLAVA